MDLWIQQICWNVNIDHLYHHLCFRSTLIRRTYARISFVRIPSSDHDRTHESSHGNSQQSMNTSTGVPQLTKRTKNMDIRGKKGRGKRGKRRALAITFGNRAQTSRKKLEPILSMVPHHHHHHHLPIADDDREYLSSIPLHSARTFHFFFLLFCTKNNSDNNNHGKDN